jgi:hypothetical protein
MAAGGFPLLLNLWKNKHLEYALGGYPVDALQHFIQRQNENIREFTIEQNRNGKVKKRTVYDTADVYKNLLKTINRKILCRATFPFGILGGIPGKAIDEMAGCHCGREAIFSIDFKKFFPSITSGMVFRFFQQAKCSNEIAGIITNLITFQKALPQGFPTNTMMANLIAYDLDVKHLEIAKRFNLIRTRWVDDIVFSGRGRDIEKAIPAIIGAVKGTGFTINNRKTRFLPRRENPVVVGLDVGRTSPHVPLVQINEVDRLISLCESDGAETVQLTYDPKGTGKIKNLKASLDGLTNFIEKYPVKFSYMAEVAFILPYNAFRRPPRAERPQ